MTRLVAIDPGVERCAIAVFADDGELLDVGFVDVPFDCPDVLWSAAWSDGIVSVVAEKPQFDRRCAKSVIDLAWSGALVAATFARGGPVVTYTPSAWKGALTKPIHHHRTLKALTPAEIGVLPPDTAARVAGACHKGGLDNWRKDGARYYGSWGGHNVLDAVALGLTHLGRMPMPARADAAARDVVTKRRRNKRRAAVSERT